MFLIFLLYFSFPSSGPQTLQDLQQKLAKLTCQPFDLSTRSGNSASQTGTPGHQPLHEGTLPQNLHQSVSSSENAAAVGFSEPSSQQFTPQAMSPCGVPSTVGPPAQTMSGVEQPLSKDTEICGRFNYC